MSNPRTPYFFDLSGVKYKPLSEVHTMRRQWDTFERVENYDNEIYNRFSQGYFDKQYYQFRNSDERNDYKVGQLLHINRYPWLPSTTFAPIRDRPMPSVPVLAKPIEFIQVSRCIIPPIPITQEERTIQQNDLSIYAHVSTYNRDHVYKYQFTNEEERFAYHRAERRILSGQP